MEILIRISQFVLSLSFLVIIHEMGHFFVAKLFHTRVEKFYLFFDPWFALFKIKKGETEYGIGWLPLGGYVKISGMVDESMDTEQLKQPPQPWELRSKPAWQRLLVMVAGVIVNFIAALVIYAMIMFVWGKDYVAMKDASYGLTYCQTALDNGFRNGDKLMAVDDKPYETYSEAFTAIIIDKARSVEVERDGQAVTIALPDDFAQRCIDEQEGFAALNIPAVIKEPVEGRQAAQAGVEAGDRITAVDSLPTTLVQDFIAAIKQNAGRTVNLTIERNGTVVNLPVAVAPDGTIGVHLQTDATKMMPATHISYSFMEAIPAGINYGVDKLVSYVKSLKFLFNKSGIKQLGGPIAIANMFPPVWDWHAFWDFTAFLSIILAFMNILPIPALDGGHVIFIIYELITGRKPSDKFLEKAQMVGMIILLGLMALAVGNDILRLIK